MLLHTIFTRKCHNIKKSYVDCTSKLVKLLAFIKSIRPFVESVTGFICLVLMLIIQRKKFDRIIIVIIHVDPTESLYDLSRLFN